MTVERIQHAIYTPTLEGISLAEKLDYAETLETSIKARFPQANVSVYLTRNTDLIDAGLTTRVETEQNGAATNAVIESVENIARQMDTRGQLGNWRQ